MATQRYFYGTGKRKTAVARVRLFPGGANFIVNGRPLDQYFGRAALIGIAQEPFTVVDQQGRFGAQVKVVGGGISGQAGAIRHGVARALIAMDEALKPGLRRAGFVTRDARIKERKKFGLKRARKAPQYTKR
ncbi:MAG TPA: 30S ribosomal protein S9 [Chloroflexota bacterium]|jgi:small subunit ribosomal protein S9|nr:30S ribosomal protein S9 [Chloroflexota bacterium]